MDGIIPSFPVFRTSNQNPMPGIEAVPRRLGFSSLMGRWVDGSMGAGDGAHGAHGAPCHGSHGPHVIDDESDHDDLAVPESDFPYFVYRDSLETGCV